MGPDQSRGYLIERSALLRAPCQNVFRNFQNSFGLLKESSIQERNGHLSADMRVILGDDMFGVREDEEFGIRDRALHVDRNIDGKEEVAVATHDHCRRLDLAQCFQW